MAFHRAKRIAAIEVSEIARLTEAAAEMRAKGIDVVALSTGEPDFATPAHVIEAAHAAALQGQTRYPATRGTAPLRAAIAEVAGADPAEVIVSTGAKQVLANAMLASLDPGDEVIIPAPYWTSYPDIVAMAGGRPVAVACPMAQGFKLTPEALAAAITPRTRWLVLNTPSNPSGALYSEAELGALAEVLGQHPDIMVLADEIYAHLAYTAFRSFRDVAPALRDRVLIVNGVSKAYAMTGWRIGWGIGPRPLIDAMTAVQGQITSGASSISQAAALAALTGPQDLLAERLAVLRDRRDGVVARLAAMPGVRCPVPDGAFYVFPNVEDAMARLGFDTDGAFCAALLEHRQLAVVPGSAFGLPGHLRLSFAYSTEDLDRGLSRIAEFLGAEHA